MVARLKGIVHHTRHDVVDVGGVRVSGAVVDGSFVGDVVGGVAGLKGLNDQRRAGKRGDGSNEPATRSAHDACLRERASAGLDVHLR